MPVNTQPMDSVMLYTCVTNVSSMSLSCTSRVNGHHSTGTAYLFVTATHNPFLLLSLTQFYPYNTHAQIQKGKRNAHGLGRIPQTRTATFFWVINTAHPAPRTPMEVRPLVFTAFKAYSEQCDYKHGSRDVIRHTNAGLDRETTSDTPPPPPPSPPAVSITDKHLHTDLIQTAFR
jgi:hypothetical protein